MSNFRRQNNPVSALVDELGDEPLALFAVIIGALVAGPALLWAFWTKVIAWALEHGVLVPVADASWTIPSAQAGLDGRRIAGAALFLIAVAAASVALTQHQRSHNAQRGVQ